MISFILSTYLIDEPFVADEADEAVSNVGFGSNDTADWPGYET